MEYERGRGWTPEYVGDLRDGSGFDVRSVGPENEVRRIEVKGRGGADATVILTPNEWTQARRHRSSYWLYVVIGCNADEPQLVRVRDPFSRIGKSAERLTVVKGFVLPGEAVEAAGEERRRR
jgi:hypothetical protein